METENFVIKSKEDIPTLIHHLYSLPADIPLSVDVKEYKVKRTIDQNALMHKWFDEISEWRIEEGWEPPQVPKVGTTGKFYKPSELMKEFFKNKFLPTVEIDIAPGHSITRKVSTTDLDTGECSHFMQQIESYCAERGIILTIPENSQYYKIQKKLGNKT